MVRLTVDLISRGTSGYTKKKRDESMTHYLKRLTHLHLEDRNIDEVGEDLASCKNLTVLYLYDNKLYSMPNLSPNSSLTHLYLQNNNINKIDNLDGLRKLSKLHLGGNAITVLEGLEKMDQLQELHIEHQKFPPGEKLLFEPRSIIALSRSLTVLNVTGNNLDSIHDLEPLGLLQQLMATDNQLTDLKELSNFLGKCRQMQRLDLIGNPLCHKSKYRDRVIIMAPYLELLDGKEVTATNRQFIQRLQANKDAQKRKRQHAITHNQHGEWSGFVTSDEKGDQDFPMFSGFKAPIPGYVMPGLPERHVYTALPRKQFQDVLARSTSLPCSANPPQNRESRQPYSEFSPPKYKSCMDTTVSVPSDSKIDSKGCYHRAIINLDRSITNLSEQTFRTNTTSSEQFSGSSTSSKIP